jgi:hypothetical protein
MNNFQTTFFRGYNQSLLVKDHIVDDINPREEAMEYCPQDRFVDGPGNYHGKGCPECNASLDCLESV